MTRAISRCTSMTRPGRTLASRVTSVSDARAIGAAKLCTMRGVKIGAMARRCARQGAPSTVSSPSLMPGESTRFCSASFA